MKPASTNLEPASPPPPPVAQYADAPVWMQRLFVGVYVLFCVTLGLTLIRLPWSEAWFETGFLNRWPDLQHILHLGFVRGAVSGLGVIDIWLGVHEALHYHDRRPASPAAQSGFEKISHEQQQ